MLGRTLFVRVLFFIAMFWSVLILADDIFVEPAEGTGADTTELKAVGELVQTAVVQLNHHIAEKATDANYSLRVHLLKLGEAYLVAVSKIKGGTPVFTSQMKALAMDDLDRVTLRLVRATIDEKPVAEEARVGEITKQEAKEGTERKPTRNMRYVALGAASLNNLNTRGVGYSLGLGYSWDLNKALVKLGLDLALQGSAYMANLGLGAYVFLAPTDIAPFLDVDFGFGIAEADNGGLFRGTLLGGFVVGGGLGLQFFRTSAINLELAAHVAAMLNMGSSGAPINFTIRVGLNY
jgi:hypothetical protein